MKSLLISLAILVMISTIINAKTIEERKGGGGGGHGGGGHGGGGHGGGGHGGGHYNSASIQSLNTFVIGLPLVFSMYLMK